MDGIAPSPVLPHTLSGSEHHSLQFLVLLVALGNLLPCRTLILVQHVISDHSGNDGVAPFPLDEHPVTTECRFQVSARQLVRLQAALLVQWFRKD